MDFFVFFSEAMLCGGVSVEPPPPPPRPSAQLEPGGGLDGVQQLVPHQVLVAELRELEQVHAGAGGGKALQVVAAVVNAEGRVELLCAYGKAVKTSAGPKTGSSPAEKWGGI